MAKSKGKFPEALKITTSKSQGLRRAAKAYGSYTAMAKRLELSAGAICRWYKIPERYLLKVEHQTGISRKKLRQDLY